MDVTSKILSVFKADTSDMRAKLKELQGDEKKLAEQRLKGIEDTNRSLQSYIGVLAKVGVALGVLKLGFEGAAISIEQTRLKTAASGTDFDKLDKAFDGLIDRTTEYQFAARLHQSALRVTQSDTLNAANAIRGMHRAGIDLTEATQRVTDALTKGESTALREYGIVVDEAKYATDKFGNRMDEQTKRTLIAHDALQQLTDKYGHFDGAQETTGEKLESTQQKVQRSVEDLKKAFGDLVISLQPAIAGLAQVVDGLTKVVDAANSIGSNKYFRAFAGLSTFDSIQVQLENELTRQQGKNFGALAGHGISDQFNKAAEAYAQRQADATISALLALTASLAKPPKPKGPTKPGAFHPAGIGSFDSADTFGLTGIATNTSLGVAADSRSLDEFGNDALAGKTEALLKEVQDAEAARKQSFLESIFGKPEEFNAYKELFDGLTNGVSSAYEAIVTGSEPAGKAFKKAIAEQMLAIGKSEAVLAIKEGAWALGDLAIGNIPGASAHALSAAEHAAAAVAAGVAAHELGAGGSSTASKGASGGGATTGGGASTGGTTQQQPQQTVIVIGEAFAESTPRMRQLQAQQVLKRAGVGNTALEDN